MSEVPSDLPAAVRADPAAIDEALRTSSVDVTAPTPGLDAYLGDVMQALSELIQGLLMRFLPGVASLAEGLATLLDPRVLWVVLVLLLAWLSVRALLRRTRPGPDVRERIETSSPAPGAAPASRSLEAWELQLANGLRSGDVTAALEALWWWLALRLDPNAEASWTSGELVRRTGRRDLRTSMRALDRLRFGTVQPSADQVSRLYERLQGALG